MLLLKFYNIKYASERQAQSLKYHLIFFPTFEVKVLEKVNYKPISKKKSALSCQTEHPKW